MNNYFGIGLDAKIALEFNRMREENPAAFKFVAACRKTALNHGFEWQEPSQKSDVVRHAGWARNDRQHMQEPATADTLEVRWFRD